MQFSLICTIINKSADPESVTDRGSVAALQAVPLVWISPHIGVQDKTEGEFTMENGTENMPEYVQSGTDIYGGGVQPRAQEPDLKAAKKRFSRVGLMYFCGTLIIYGIQFLVVFLVQLIKPQWISSVTGSLLVSMLPMYLIGMPLMMFLITRVPGEGVKKTGRLSVGQMFLAFFMCYALMYVSNIIGTIITFLIGMVKGSGVDNQLVGIVMETNPLVIFVIMVLCAPVVEELVFRKLLVDRTVKYGEGVAVVLSGLMFGLFHGNLNQFAYAFSIGLFFAFIYVKTGKIRYTVILHMIVNLLGSVISLVVMEASGYTDYMAAFSRYMADPSNGVGELMELLPRMMIIAAYGIFLFGSMVTGIILLIVQRKKFRLDKGEVTIPKGKRFNTVILNVGMILFTLFWLFMIIAQLFM